REASLSVTGGSNERLDLSGSVRGGGDVFGWSVDGGRRSIELVPGHAGTAGTYATRLDGAARMRWRIAPSFELTAGGLLLDERQRWSSGVLYNCADNTQWSARVGARHERGRRSLSTTLYATGFHPLARRSTLPQPVAGSGESEVQRLIEAELVYG